MVPFSIIFVGEFCVTIYRHRSTNASAESFNAKIKAFFIFRLAKIFA